MKDLARRTFISSALVILLTILIVFAFDSLFQYVVAILIAGLTGVAIWEYGQLALAKGGRLMLPVLIGVGVAQVLSFFYVDIMKFQGLPLFIFFIAMVFLFALHFKENQGALVDLASSAFALIYIAVPMGMVLGILYFGHGQDGRFWIAYLLIVTKIADVGAYFAGNLWGKKKLAPTISPKKTVEGAICGLICAMLVSYGFHCLSSSIPGIYFDLTLFQSIILGLLLGLIGQFGDLSESLLKRDANKKDSNSLPGLGGALDSIDSLLFNSAIVYIYLNHFKM